MANLCDLLSYRQRLMPPSLQRRIFNEVHSHLAFVERLAFSSELQGHSGCVNCLQWNTSGSLLASGSDDTSAILWDPHQRKAVATMPTGHTGNIFSVKFQPFSGDKVLITGSEDGEVRLHDLTTFDTTQVWSCSQGRVKRVATSPQSPFLCWSASEDGCVRRLDSRERHTCSTTGGGCRNIIIDIKHSKSILHQPAQCKCIDINPVRTEQIAVGALDAYARIYDARLCSLRSMGPVASPTDPSCIAFFAPGHLCNPSLPRLKKSSGNNMAATYISFSANGEDLLVNLSGEQVYLYNITNYQQPIAYDFDKTDSVPILKPTLRTCSRSNGIGTRLKLPVSYSIPLVSVEESDISSEVVRLKNRGKQLYKAEKIEEALLALNAGIAKCPNWHLLYFLRGTTLYSRKWSGDVYAALRDIETALSLCPNHKLSQQRRIQCLTDLGMLEEAKRFLHIYQSDHPGDSKFFARTAKEVEKEKKEANPSASNGYHHHSNGRSTLFIPQQRVSDYKSRFCGHCNTHTDIKEAVFIGDRGNYVAAGSDDGNIFIWERASGNLVRVLKGDSSIVNCIQWNPATPMMATSGIENVVRLWEPRSEQRGELESDHVDMESKSDASGEAEGDRVVSDVVRVCKDNQHRMGVDPFEVMLMRMGFRLHAMAEEGAAEGHHHQGGARGEAMEEEGGELRWVNNPANCRQS